MITVINLSFSYGPRTIFDDVSFSVPENYKVGLVGPNGAGKSTLLSLLMKEEFADQGKIETLGNIGYVPQEVKYDPTLESSETIRIYLDPLGRFHDYELQKMLEGLELGHLVLENSPKNLSGGQKTKLALARALLAEPDILLLDEPTNFMDVAGRKWVMDFLSTYSKTLLIISHDLALLDKAINKVLFVNPQTKKVEEYSGNYTKFQQLKREREELVKKEYLKQQQKIARMEEGLRRSSGKTSAKGVRQRVIMQRRVAREKEKLPDLPIQIKQMKKIVLSEPTRVGELALKASSIFKAYGETVVLEDVNFSILRGERVALIGPNGAGKSTLIKILVGLLRADSGEVIKDDRLKIGYYSQEFETFDLEKSVKENIKDATNLPDGFIRSVLGRFLIDAEKLDQDVITLSGGEKTRLAIAQLLLQDFNLLILDEPTTYLDVTSQRIILDGLKDYKGAMLIVSHTEEFIKELEPDKVVILPENFVDVYSDTLLDKVSEV